METEQQKNPEEPTPEGTPPNASGDELVRELGRLGRKFVELLETAWDSDQRRQIEQDLRKGLNSVADSLESGLKELGEKEKTKEFIGKAESVADDMGDKVRSSDAANDLARGLAKGLHVLADRLDQLTTEMRTTHSSGADTDASTNTASEEAQDIPIRGESESDTSA